MVMIMKVIKNISTIVNMITLFKTNKTKELIFSLNKSVLLKWDNNLKKKKESIYADGYYSDNVKKWLYFSIIHLNDMPRLNDSEGTIEFNNGKIHFFIETELTGIVINYLSDFPLSYYSGIKAIEFFNITDTFIKPTENSNYRYLAIFHNNWRIYEDVPDELRLLSPKTHEDIFFHDFLLIDEQQQMFQIKEYFLHKQKNDISSFYVAYDNGIHLKKNDLKKILNSCNTLNHIDINWDNLSDSFEALDNIQINNAKNGYKREIFK
jgi:hypothetical protein